MNAPITVGIEDAAPEGFIVDDEDKAAWAVSVIRARRRHIADLEEQHAARIAKAGRELESAERLFLPQLEAFARAELKRQGPRAPRHVDVATGRLQFTHRSGGIKITDEKAIMAFAELLPEGVREVVERRIDKERVKLGLGVVYTKAMAEALAEIGASSAPPDGVTALAMAMEKAAAALPAGATVTEDRDDFKIVSGGDDR